MRAKAGFTLVEIMIVVSVIALLAVMALPSFMRARERAQNVKFANSLRVASGAFEVYATEHGVYPLDVNRGVIPSGMGNYFDPTFDWTKETPIGGNWDWDANNFGFVAAVSVVGSSATTSQFQAIDAQMDDGDLSTGQFQDKGSGRYSYILQ